MCENDKPEGARIGWELLETSYPFQTTWLKIRQDRISLKGQDEITFSYVDRAGSVGIVPLTSDGKILMIKQYRYTVDEWCVEVPAGGSQDTPGISLEEVARTELHQEIGAVCGELKYIGFFYTSIGNSAQTFHVFLALDVEICEEQKLEPTESIQICPMSIRDAMELVYSGQLRDGASALALTLCTRTLQEYGLLQ